MAKRGTEAAGRINDALGLRFESYQRTIERIRQAVEQLIPVGSTVLVVSKGDPALLAFGERTGWHFPRAADGQYAGFHPADSRDAITRLDVQRQLGARYLVIPSTTGWWLEHYSEFIGYVRSSGRTLLHDPELAWIFELSANTVSADPALDATSAAEQSARQLITLLDAVLPPIATIAVLAIGDKRFPAHPVLPTIALSFAVDTAIDVSAVIKELEVLASGSADFLVVPASSREWLNGQPALAEHIAKSYSLVTHQSNVCTIYDLKPQNERVR